MGNLSLNKPLAVCVVSRFTPYPICLNVRLELTLLCKIFLVLQLSQLYLILFQLLPHSLRIYKAHFDILPSFLNNLNRPRIDFWFKCVVLFELIFLLFYFFRNARKLERYDPQVFCSLHSSEF